ncbi:MAG TPA: hypothetical protein VK538_12465 [Solirubrobacteraceae bacterium]|nr:hypothetical protein [Solirubrobacteraceae bacterium]
MSATAVETSALVELERLQGLVGAQRERVRELERASQEAARRVARARGALEDLYLRREMDEAQDLPVGPDAEEQELIEELREAEGGLSVRPVVYPQGDLAPEIGLDAVNPMVEARLKGARMLLQERESELGAFVVAHVGDLAVERAPRARQVVEQVQEALRVAAAAAALWQGEHTWWAGVLKLTVGEGENAQVDLPENPLTGLSTGVRVSPPLPEHLIEQDEDR